MRTPYTSRPLRLNRSLLDAVQVRTDPIETNLENADLDIIGAIVGSHRPDARLLDSCDFVKMDRSLNDLFENASRLNVHEVAERIGALAARTHTVDLRQVAVRGAEILAWADAQNILKTSADADEWALSRSHVTFFPHGKGWKDARLSFDTFTMSKQGLISREAKLRQRERTKRRVFALAQAHAALVAVPDKVPLTEVAAKLLYPCRTVSDWKANFSEMTGMLTLWETVRLQWTAEQLLVEEMQLPWAAVDWHL